MRVLSRKTSRALLLSGMLALSACALKDPPDHATLTQDALGDPGKPPAAWQEPGGTAGAILGDWLPTFHEPALEALVHEALVQNADLRAAAAKVEQAQAALDIAAGALWPTVTLLGRAGGKSGSDNTIRGGLIAASWEIDLWGRLRYAKRASKSDYESARADFVYARQSLAAMVAKAWFTAAEASEQQKIAREMLQSSEKLGDLAGLTKKIGSGSDLEVALADVNVQTYRDSVRQLELARQQALRALEILAGRYPAAALAASDTLPALPPPVPVGVPSELLERRPDVVAAERRVAAAFDRVGEAKAARLPTVVLGLGASWINSDLFILKDSDNPKVGGSASAGLPLLTGGRLAAQVELRNAEQRQAVAQYASIGLKAFSEVESALANEASLGDRQGMNERLVQDNAQVRKLSETRFRVGSGDLRDVLNDDLRLAASRTQLVTIRAQRLAQRVNLHLALGGGYGTEDAVGAR
jgi:NodT family efflux transporter outer membrane factor (OMF) lipoprotein